MKDEIINAEYTAMRSAQSMRQIKWVSAYSKNPELASVILEVFDMPEEDIEVIIRTLNSLKDSLKLYKNAATPKQKKKVREVMAATV